MTTEEMKRHGCLTAWLVLMIITNSGAALMYLMLSDAIRTGLSNVYGWVFPVMMIIFCLFNIVCLIALFQWKKWGFWGFFASSVVVFFLNLLNGLPIVPSLSGLIGFLMLFGALQIGKENKGWPQLE